MNTNKDVRRAAGELNAFVTKYSVVAQRVVANAQETCEVEASELALILVNQTDSAARDFFSPLIQAPYREMETVILVVWKDQVPNLLVQLGSDSRDTEAMKSASQDGGVPIVAVGYGALCVTTLKQGTPGEATSDLPSCGVGFLLSHKFGSLN